MALCQSRENCWLTSFTSGGWNMQISLSRKQPLNWFHAETWENASKAMCTLQSLVNISNGGEHPLRLLYILRCMHAWLLALALHVTTTNSFTDGEHGAPQVGIAACPMLSSSVMPCRTFLQFCGILTIHPQVSENHGSSSHDTTFSTPECLFYPIIFASFLKVP